MSRARNLAGFVTAISPVTDLNCGIVSAIRFVGPFDVEVGLAQTATYAETSGIATYASTAGIATNATYATTAGIATYATTAGVATDAQGLTGSPDIVVGNITASGNVSIAGTITYEDVTSVDSIGVITARQGIRVGAGESIGSTGSSEDVVYYGDGSKLTGIITSGGDGTWGILDSWMYSG